MTINNKHEIGHMVFLKSDIDQHPRIVAEIKINQNGILYNLACGVFDSWHFCCEISKEKDVLKSLGI